MNARAILCSQMFLVLIRTASVKNPCSHGCKIIPEQNYQHTRIKHVSDLGDSSVAPWELRINNAKGREPANIQYAVCKNCTVAHMVSKPIYIEILVYKRISQQFLCRCPYQVAVGCTCVTTPQA